MGSMWVRVLSKSGFFKGLKWMPDGRQLWSDLSRVGEDHNLPVSILTGLPRSCKKAVAREKKEWCLERLTTSHDTAQVEVITCMSAEKHRWSGAGCILIDDRASARQPWESKGGAFIHHIPGHGTETIRQLVQVLGGSHESCMSAPSADAVVAARADTRALLAGAITRGGDIAWEEGGEVGTDSAATAVAEAHVIIIRGVPGSGKSGCANALVGDHGHICSADHFFEAGAGSRKRKGERPSYAESFSVNRLPEAHTHCWRQFQEAIRQRKSQFAGGDTAAGVSTAGPWPVIVDNTNSRRNDYARYTEAAEEQGLRSVVIELYLRHDDKAAALRYNSRSVHGVPSHVNLKMLAQWEHDPAALLIRPLERT